MNPRPSAVVDVVIVNYRSYDELTRCLASLDRSRAHLQQVVVVDHESNLEAAARIAAAFPWVRLIERSTNEGFATGVNLGVRQTRAPFILLLNPDCVVDEQRLHELIAFAQQHPHAAIVGPRILNADGSVQGSARRFPGLTTAFAGRSSWLTRRFPNNPLSRRNLPALDAQETPLDVDWVSGACMLVRREALDQVGGMDERFFLYWEDADLCRRLTDVGWRIVYFPGATIVHAGGRSSIHAYRESLYAFHRSALFLFRKHAAGPARLFQPLVYLALHARLQLMLRLHRHRLTDTHAETHIERGPTRA
jgi:GT2 family glycosyltransferase